MRIKIKEPLAKPAVLMNKDCLINQIKTIHRSYRTLVIQQYITY